MAVKELKSKALNMKNVLSFVFTLIATIVVWNLPTDSFGIDGLTVVQQRIIAIFVFATLSWLTEAIPAWATSLVIIMTMCEVARCAPFSFLLHERFIDHVCSVIRGRPLAVPAKSCLQNIYIYVIIKPQTIVFCGFILFLQNGLN